MASRCYTSASSSPSSSTSATARSLFSSGSLRGRKRYRISSSLLVGKAKAMKPMTTTTTTMMDNTKKKENKRRTPPSPTVCALPSPETTTEIQNKHPCEKLLDESRVLYESGERMQGYKKLEQAMKRKDEINAPVEIRREIRYQAICCGAAFGDVELAKQYLREMELLGLAFDLAMENRSLMRMEASALMLNQLKKFATGSEKSFGTVQREVYEKTQGGKILTDGPGGTTLTPPGVLSKGLEGLEIDNNTDASASGIAKRVGGVIVIAIGGFYALFSLGLKLIQESGY